MSIVGLTVPTADWLTTMRWRLASIAVWITFTRL
jgi:hypothetical protein